MLQVEVDEAETGADAHEFTSRMGCASSRSATASAELEVPYRRARRRAGS